MAEIVELIAADHLHIMREVYGPLAGCRRRASPALRARLGRQWRAFMDARIRDRYQDPPPQVPTCQLRQTRPAGTAPRRADPAFAPLACVCPACTHELDPVPDGPRPAASRIHGGQLVPLAGPEPAQVTVLPGTAGASRVSPAIPEPVEVPVEVGVAPYQLPPVSPAGGETAR